jgi:SpoVK/Ycf46/Vps4 family AAA+-type ATPase
MFWGKKNKDNEKKENEQPKEEKKSDNKNFTKYKFKELKIYSSDEWMAGSTKKYRTVFERAETTYIRAEFSFYNKLFDEESWKCKVTYKCFSVDKGNRKELCNYDVEKEVKIDENIVYIRDGWGNATAGAFWFRGDYDWEAYIDGQLVATSRFYVEDVGEVTSKLNPYFDIEHVKLYEGDYDGKSDGKFYKKISQKDTRYLWVNFGFKNKTDKDYYCEVFFNFYDDAGQPKGQDIRNVFVKANTANQVYTIHGGWGNSTGGSWKDDKYTLEIVFMDKLMCVVPFEAGDAYEEGQPDIITSFEEAVQSVGGVKGASGNGAATQNKEGETIEELLAKLDALIGLENIKKEVRDQMNNIKFAQLRKDKGIDDNTAMNLHSVFTGNPGTGKTTVVNMLGKIYKSMGLLSKGHVKEVDRSDLVAQYIGQTAPKVKKIIDEARGGILFIDEAYSLSRAKEDKNDFGHEVLEILIKEMSDGKGDLAIMYAGYPKEMKGFVETNPGMKSRIGHYFHFEDYLPEELSKIADFACNKYKVTLVPEAKSFLDEMLIDAYRGRDNTFGNARFVYGIINEAKEELGLRLMKHPDLANLTAEQMSLIDAEDIRKVFAAHGKKKLKLDVDDKLLKEGLGELNELVGMDNLKAEINELVKLARFYREMGKDVLNKFSLHSVFTGNPGTGKTTVARIVAKIYKGLGLLERGHIVEVDREGLVAGYIGQTAPKTAAKIEEAMGGILFIDEAYGLTDGSSQGQSGNFGSEAIQIILKRMEDLRGQFGVIVAGYPDNMNKFIESNPGLKSRFDRTFHFEDYNPADMYQIALRILAKEKIKPDTETATHLQNYFDFLHANRDKHFGNARTVRQVVGESVKNQNLRLASMDSSARTHDMLSWLTIDDVKEFEIKEKRSTGSQLGFKVGGSSAG